MQLIEIYNACEKFHTMPRAGALFDQDARLMYLLNRLSEYVEKRAELDRAKGQGNGP